MNGQGLKQGLELVSQAFADNKVCFMPYFPVGYPDYETSLYIMEGMAKAGADLIEVGVPFSDPLADGPAIQRATQIALENGTSLPDCVEAIRELRRRGVTIPLMLMSYVNPLIAYGLETLVKDAVEAGISGFIVPDLPADEAENFQALAEAHGLAFVHFLAPTSNEERIALAAERAQGFIYVVSVTGVTGERTEVPPDLKDFIARVRRVAKQPLAVGFGISSPEKAIAIGKIADGIIVGTKLVNLAQESPEAVLNFARDVKQALE
jgi:tryptophan synthase alpha chain